MAPLSELIPTWTKVQSRVVNYVSQARLSMAYNAYQLLLTEL